MEKRVKQKILLPNDIIILKEHFKRHGFKLFLVGGAVRDTLLGLKIKDFDLATDAHPEQVSMIIKETEFKVIPIGEAFGVMNVVTLTDQYEIATFRTDGEYSNDRRPDSVIFSNIENDVKRRDLTINALFYDIDTEEIVDLVGGIDDIKNKVINTVGSPNDRFSEDRLRILRAIRFSTRLGFSLSDNIIKALGRDSNLGSISNERIRDEFIKSVKSAKSVKKLIETYYDFNLVGQIFKGVSVISMLPFETNDHITLIAFLLRFSSDLKVRLNDLTYTIDEIRKISFLIDLYEGLSRESAPRLKKLQIVSKVSDNQIREFCKRVSMCDKFVEAFIEFKLSISGQWVMDEFNLKGPALGKKIQEIEISNFSNLLN